MHAGCARRAAANTGAGAAGKQLAARATAVERGLWVLVPEVLSDAGGSGDAHNPTARVFGLHRCYRYKGIFHKLADDVFRLSVGHGSL
jgi:hypothetical protein